MRDSSSFDSSVRRFMGKGMRILALLAGGAVIASMAGATVPKIGEKAPEFKSTTLSNKTVKLPDALKKGPVVLVVLRGYPGYQCPICNMQVGSLIAKGAQLKERKAQVILVYPGPAEGLKQHADEFVTGKSLPDNFQIVLDPDYVLIKKYDLRWDAPNETSYPSTFVIDQKGKIRFAKVSHSHGDRAKPEEILKALDGQKMMEEQPMDKKTSTDKTDAEQHGGG